MQTLLTENFHTHTTRCGHASGTDREYIEAAIAAGFRILGFSDHAPMPFPDGHESSHRVPIARTDDYFSSLVDLRREYRADIDIRIGFEAEYYPSLFDRFLDFLAPYPLDYLLLGQHFIADETTPGSASTIATEDPERLQTYLDTVREGVETGRFLYVAHPDIFRFTGADDVYAAHVVPFLHRMKELDVALEINRLGLEDHRHYPCERFFRLCAQVGNRIVIGVDAHSPDTFAGPGVGQCFAFAERLGLTVDLHPSASFVPYTAPDSPR